MRAAAERGSDDSASEKPPAIMDMWNSDDSASDARGMVYQLFIVLLFVLTFANDAGLVCYRD